MRLLAPVAVLSCVFPATLALWPRPASLTHGNATVQIDTAAFRFDLVPSASAQELPADLQQALARSLASIKRDTLHPLVVGRGESQRSTVERAPVLSSVRIELGKNANTNTSPKKKKTTTTTTTLKDEVLQAVEDYDEAYELTVPANGSAGLLRASSALGIVRGLATLEQLFFDLPARSPALHTSTQMDRAHKPFAAAASTSTSTSSGSRTRYIPNAPLHISDKPAFPWRGVLLDTSRNFFSVGAIERMLDAMAFLKFNTFHWHIVDAQSFPLQLPGKLGVLAERGAYSPQMVYSPSDIAHLVNYAAQRGININAEIDMPGHMYEGIVQYDPDIVVCPNEQDWTHWANEPPSGQLSINDSSAVKFATDLVTAAAKLFPGAYFSTGGDEVNTNCYNATDNAQLDTSLMKPFITTLHTALAERAHKRPLVWEEIALNFPQTAQSLRNGTVVEAWTSSANVGAILRGTPPGVSLIHAPSDYFYLDCGAGGWLGNAPNLQSWCPFVTWQKSYAFDPYAGTEGIEGGRERVLGGEAALWTEQADEVSMDGYLWPRAGSAAEVFWTGASYKDNDVNQTRNGSEALPRLHEVRFRLVDRGYAARPLQPLWCALRPGQCDLV
ncbi:Glucosamine-6-phosphate isomerase (Glucosamine-6-phosphate deaminase) (GNPDA) (GlcN6P deaminase) [Tilletia horrida]|nr:Glucosamine-6-phosphate isomerase (Glucosamine-6-phosphate deaminase) (GNPDA) (GlcN6P deaminase) [Tilletia horrida]